MDVFIGDKVKTPDGIGYVVDVIRYDDIVSGVSNLYAIEFTEYCRREVGADYRKRWCRIMVRIGDKTKRFKADEVEVLDSRLGK